MQTSKNFLNHIISEEINRAMLLKEICKKSPSFRRGSSQEYINPTDGDIIYGYAVGLQEMHDRIIKENPDLKREIVTLKIGEMAKELKHLSDMVKGIKGKQAAEKIQ